MVLKLLIAQKIRPTKELNLKGKEGEKNYQITDKKDFNSS